MRIRIVEGDLLDQDVDAIVNAWNRNIGGFDEAGAEALILDTLGSLDADLEVLVVRFRP